MVWYENLLIMQDLWQVTVITKVPRSSGYPSGSRSAHNLMSCSLFSAPRKRSSLSVSNFSNGFLSCNNGFLSCNNGFLSCNNGYLLCNNGFLSTIKSKQQYICSNGNGKLDWIKIINSVIFEMYMYMLTLGVCKIGYFLNRLRLSGALFILTRYAFLRSASCRFDLLSRAFFPTCSQSSRCIWF